jgi:putative Mg2+ transporter-C (MgtC) family protein
MDPARVASGIVTGIGFLGAGTIIASKVRVRGLTTAATLWVTAAVGLAVGAGVYIPAVITAVLVFLVLQMWRIEIEIGD